MGLASVSPCLTPYRLQVDYTLRIDTSRALRSHHSHVELVKSIVAARQTKGNIMIEYAVVNPATGETVAREPSKGRCATDLRDRLDPALLGANVRLWALFGHPTPRSRLCSPTGRYVG